MADCLYLRGDEDAACRQFERVLAVANDVGLLAEEYDAPAQRLAGNSPKPSRILRSSRLRCC